MRGNWPSSAVQKKRDNVARDVEVSVANGEVSFSGSVVDRWTKFAIEELAERYVQGDRIRNAIKVSHRNDTTGWTDGEWPIGS